MSNVSMEEVISYFKKKNQVFTNSKGMQLGLTEKMELWSDFYLTTLEDGLLEISLYTEDDNATQFAELFELNTVEEIDDLDIFRAMKRYLNGNAEVTVEHADLEVTLRFRIFKRKTIIYCHELHFYDEVYEHFKLPKDFEQYVSSNENKLNLAGQNRYKMNN